MKTFFNIVTAGLFLALSPQSATSSPKSVPVYGFEIVNRYPHDASAYTQGFFIEEGFLYESTGEIGSSSLRKVELQTGKVLQEVSLPIPFYGEGIVSWKDSIIQLTWQNQTGFIYDKASFRPTGSFSYLGEGWALTKDDAHLYMSDGTANLRVLNPDSLNVESVIHVADGNVPVTQLNEIEWVKGEIYANVWLTNRIARINPKTGQVIGWIDLTGIFDASSLPDPSNDVLNGIAYDAKADKLFVTGKRWPTVFEIRLVPSAEAPM